MNLPPEMAEQIIAHAQRDHPHEACGLVAGSGEPTRVFAMTNAERSPVLYRMDPAEQLRVFREIDEAGLELLAIYHSHTRSPAYPSATDVELAYYDDAVYLIVSLAEEKPVLRGFNITDGDVQEVEVTCR